MGGFSFSLTGLHGSSQMFRRFLWVWFKVLQSTGSSLVPFPPFCSSPSRFALTSPSYKLSPIFTTARHSAFVLPHFDLQFFDAGENQITSLQSPPFLDIIQQRDWAFFDNLVMEAAINSLACIKLRSLCTNNERGQKESGFRSRV